MLLRHYWHNHSLHPCSFLFREKLYQLRNSWNSDVASFAICIYTHTQFIGDSILKRYIDIPVRNTYKIPNMFMHSIFLRYLICINRTRPMLRSRHLSALRSDASWGTRFGEHFLPSRKHWLGFFLGLYICKYKYIYIHIYIFKKKYIYIYIQWCYSQHKHFIFRVKNNNSIWEWLKVRKGPSWNIGIMYDNSNIHQPTLYTYIAVYYDKHVYIVHIYIYAILFRIIPTALPRSPPLTCWARRFPLREMGGKIRAASGGETKRPELCFLMESWKPLWNNT